VLHLGGSSDFPAFPVVLCSLLALSRLLWHCPFLHPPYILSINSHPSKCSLWDFFCECHFSPPACRWTKCTVMRVSAMYQRYVTIPTSHSSRLVAGIFIYPVVARSATPLYLATPLGVFAVAETWRQCHLRPFWCPVVTLFMPYVALLLLLNGVYE
jgi:hypothetical protein